MFFFETRCCDSEFISSVSFSNSHLLMAAQLFLFSVMTPTVGREKENENYALFSLEELPIGSVHSGKRTFSFLNMVAYLQIIHWDFNITNFLPLEETCHRLHFSFCRQLSNLSSYYPESFCGTVLMNAVTTPVLGCSKVWMALARLFRWQLQQMRVQQEHGRGCVIT